MKYSTTLFKKSIYLLVILFSTLNINAQYFWVGGTGDWTDYSNHWATTSGGSNFHSSAPTTEDDVYFDANSFTDSGQTVTVSESISYCKDMDWTGAQYFPSINMEIAYSAINIHGSLTFIGDANYNIETFNLSSSQMGQTVTTNGAEFGTNNRFILVANGGEYSMTDNLTCSKLQLTYGTFNTNNNTLTAESELLINGSAALTANFGSSDIYTQYWQTLGTETMTINASSTTIYTRNMIASDIASAGFEYNDVVFTGSWSYLLGNGTFNDLDLTLCAGTYFDFEAGGTIECNDIILVNDIHSPIDFRTNGNDPGYATIVKNGGTIELSYVELSNIHASGSANFIVNPGVDHGDNDGWSFTAIQPRDFFWVENGGSWDDISHWSSTSGGLADYGDYPSRYDNVTLDGNSFYNASQQISINIPAEMNDFNWLESGDTPGVYAAYANPVTVNGDFSVADDVSGSFYNFRKGGQGSSSVYLGSQFYVQNFSFQGPGDYDIDSEINCANFSIYGGNVYTNDNTINSSIAVVLNSSESTFELGASQINANNWRMFSQDMDMQMGTSVISVESEFRGGAIYYNHLIATDQIIIKDNNTFGTLEFEPGVICQLTDGSVQTINNNLIIEGSPSLPITIKSSVNGSTATLTKSSGTVNASFVTLQDNIATGGATFNALQAIDNGNNTGWNIELLQPHDYYWVGNGGDWSDSENHWVSTSGGNVFYTYPPGTLDNVYFDENSFSMGGQEVIIDQDFIFFETMDWTGAANIPFLSGYNKTINCYGSLIFIENMVTDVTYFNFLGTENHTIDFGYEGSPNTNAQITFTSGGTWDIVSSLTTWNLTLESGIVNLNGNDMDVEFQTYFGSDEYKELNLGASNYYTRSMTWLNGGNMLLDASEANISSSSFSPYPYYEDETVTVLLNNVHMTTSFSNVVSLGSTMTLNQLSVEPGDELQIRENRTITVNELIVEGTAEDEISINCEQVGSQAFISKESGTVNGTYLVLRDIAAIGGATFYADNSINDGNVSGWIFTGLAQSITFPEISDVLEDVGTVTLDATASSGLDIEYSVVSGPAIIEGNVLTILGAGMIEIQASQQGNSEFNPAPSQTISFCSNPFAPIISGEINFGYVTLTANENQECFWFFEGDQLNLVPTAFDNVQEAGNYQAQAVVDGCASVLSEVYTVTTISIDEYALVDNVNLYPNPVIDELIISLTKIEEINIEIYNVSGQLVYFSNNDQSNELKIDFSSFESGMYFINVFNEKGKYSTSLVKQ